MATKFVILIATKASKKYLSTYCLHVSALALIKIGSFDQVPRQHHVESAGADFVARGIKPCRILQNKSAPREHSIRTCYPVDDFFTERSFCF